MAQQTAVEWLQAEFNKWAEGRLFIPQDILERAKQMEKEQIVNFCFECLRGDNIHTIKNNKELFEYIEQYYNETYKK